MTIGEDIIPADQLVAAEFYRSWLKPQRFFHRLCGVTSREDDRIAYIEAMRAQSQARHNAEQWRFIESLLPHLRRALRCNGYLWRLVISQDMLNHLTYAILAVDGNRRLLFANTLAPEELFQKNGLKVRSGALCASAPTRTTVSSSH